MTDSVGIRALQQHASAVVARAAAGEEIVITDRGRPVARIVPLRQTTLEGLIAQGLVTPGRGAFAPLDERIRIEDGPTLSEMLAEMRADER